MTANSVVERESLGLDDARSPVNPEVGLGPRAVSCGCGIESPSDLLRGTGVVEADPEVGIICGSAVSTKENTSGGGLAGLAILIGDKSIGFLGYMESGRSKISDV
jgi:hypothetical protein